MSIFEKLKNCNVLCQGSETLIALAPTNISTGFKAEFCELDFADKQPFTKKSNLKLQFKRKEKNYGKNCIKR